MGQRGSSGVGTQLGHGTICFECEMDRLTATWFRLLRYDWNHFHFTAEAGRNVALIPLEIIVKC